MMKINYLVLMIITVLMTSCSTKNKADFDDEFGETEEVVYRKALKTLASDEFLGRKPFTEGEELTLDYLEEAFDTLGIEPGNGDSYFQDVPMVDIESKLKDDKAIIEGEDADLELTHLDDFVAATKRFKDTQEIKDAPMVFAGFGINAPEYDWNDYKDLDVKGKVVVVLINDPGYYDEDLFRGNDMTYYGRWKYKFEEAAKQGAEGLLIVHDTEPASYGWNVPRNSWSKSRLTLDDPNGNEDKLPLEGWISGPAAEKVFEMADVSEYKELLKKALKADFKPVPLEVQFSTTIENNIQKKESKNVIAKIPGKARKDEHVLFSAHWDHFGVGETIDGDSIYNGAADNASGVAALLTLAKKFKDNPQTERSVVFFMPTAEEQGLLGSQYYAEHPVYPLENTVLNINFDILQPFGLMEDIFNVGLGQSDDIDAYLEEAAEELERTVRQRPDASDGWFYRSDHFSFAKAGVPVLYIENGVESLEHGKEWGQRQKEDYFENRYHQPSDTYSSSWDVSGSMADLRLMFHTSLKLLNSNDFLEWNDDILFKEAQDKLKNEE